MTEGEVNYLLSVSIRYTCAKLGIDDFGVVTREELMGMIKGVSPATHDLLKDFVTSYQEWFNFSQTCDVKQIKGEMTTDDFAKLSDLTAKRDQSRIKITDRLKEIK